MSNGNLDDEDDEDYPPLPCHGGDEHPDLQGELADAGDDEEDEDLHDPGFVGNPHEEDATPYE